MSIYGLTLWTEKERATYVVPTHIMSSVIIKMFNNIIYVVYIYCMPQLCVMAAVILKA